MLVDDQPAFFYAYLGAMKVGAVPVALNLRSAPADLLYAIKHSGSRMLILSAEFLPTYQAIAADVKAPFQVILADGSESGFPRLSDVMAGHPRTLKSEEMKPNEMALWIYTSGTTGPPKGAVHLITSMDAADPFLKGVLGVGPGDRLYCSSKLFFAYSLGHALLGSMRVGATTILFKGWPSTDAVVDVVERHKPTVMLSVPTLYASLLRDRKTSAAAFRDVRLYVSAGEKLSNIVFERWREATGRPIIDGIGATEAVMIFMANRPDVQRPGSCGYPFPETEMQLRDENDQPVTEPGQLGIGWVRTTSLAREYWNNEEKTKASFQGGWYRTGDVFIRDENGWFYHQGRCDDMLKVSGQWVSPTEIEEVVRRNPNVRDVAVISAPTSDGLDRLTMYLVSPVPPAERPALEKSLIDALRAELSIYKCPRRIKFLEDDLPRTATGKLQRFKLREMAIADGVLKAS